MHDTIKWLNCVVHYLNVKINWKLVDKINAQLCSTLKWERMQKKWTSWARRSPLRPFNRLASFQEVGGSDPRESAILDGRWTETVRKENRRPRIRRVICVIIYSVRSRMTWQHPKNDSWKLTSKGTKIWEYVDEFALFNLFSDFLLASKKREKIKPNLPPTLHWSLL